jgi:hypothetical protein
VINDNLNRATTDESIIRGWWSERDYNIAIATGEGSGVWVLDIDGDEGEQTLRKLEAEHGALPSSIEVITARGRHIYFQWPAHPIRNSAGKIAPGIDVRGEGGYVLVPPSICTPAARNTRGASIAAMQSPGHRHGCWPSLAATAVTARRRRRLLGATWSRTVSVRGRATTA